MNEATERAVADFSTLDDLTAPVFFETFCAHLGETYADRKGHRPVRWVMEDGWPAEAVFQFNHQQDAIYFKLRA